MNNVQKGNIGVSIIVQIIGVDGEAFNIADASVLAIKYKKPNGVTGSWTATVLNADDGQIEFKTTAASDLDQVGDWMIQGYAEFSDGRKIRTTQGRLHVDENV
jgi:hypothetical protein